MLFVISLIGHMEEGAFSGDEDLTLMLLNNLRMMMQPLELDSSVRSASFHLRMNSNAHFCSLVVHATA